ncbi:MAG: ABC transporter substrate-binding protein [Pseudomonadota bacterium]
MKKLLTTAAALVFAAGATAQAQELTVAVANMSATLEPGRDHSNVGSQFYVNTFEPLLGKNANIGENEFLPALATEWTLVSDTVAELKIREGVTFHNGDPMTMDDVVFSLETMITPAYDGRIARSREIFGNIDRVDVIDETTLQVIAKRPEPLMELILNSQNGFILPKAYLMGLTGDPNLAEEEDFVAFSLAPIGTGPYRIAEFVPGERLIWERFDGYWGTPAPYERITVRKIPELSARVTALVNNEVDLITNLPPDQLAVVDNSPKHKTVGGVTPIFHLVFFAGGPDNKIITPELRKALSLSVDRDLLNEALWLGKAVVPPTHTYPQYGVYYTPEIQTFEYDPERAKAIVEENGLEGTKVEFITDAFYYTNGLLAAQAMQEMWREIGIEIEIIVTSSWECWGCADKISPWSNPMYFADPHGSFGVMWSPVGAGITNGYWEPLIGLDAYTKLYDAFRYETDPDARNAAFAEVMAVVKEDSPFLLNYQPYESWGMRTDLDWAPFPGHIPYVLDFRAGAIADAKNGITK